MQCVQVDSSDVVMVVSPQPADVSTCTAVLVSPQEVGFSPFSLSVADATSIGLAIWGAWAAAWAVRLIIRALNVGDSNHEKSG